MICIVYWINAIISPTCICPPSTPWAPTHTIRILIPFIINIIAGIIKVMARLTKRFVFVRSRFATSNRSSSCFSVWKARMTESPVSISLVTRLTRSTIFCRMRNFGITQRKSTRTSARMSTTPRAMIQVMDTLVLITL